MYNCDIVCYREKEGEVNSLNLLHLNQQALRLTVKMVYERRSATRSLWPVCWTKKGIQVTRISWPYWIVEVGNVEWLAHRPLAPKCHFLLEKFGKESSVWDRSQREKNADLSRLWGKSFVKRIEQSLQKASDRDRSLRSTSSGRSLAHKKRERNLNIETRQR